MVELVARQAVKRGYLLDIGIMSSKHVGINHKEYGVTTTSVVKFAEITMAELGIANHRQPFRIKFTGGPSGEVAGNAMEILLERCPLMQVQLIVDGSAALNDSADAGHMAPAGGRPETVDSNNCLRHFAEDGAPNARANDSGTLLYTEISDAISGEINRHYTRLFGYFQKNPHLCRQSLYRKAILNHLPGMLHRERRFRNRVDGLPEKIKYAILASEIASSMVYRDNEDETFAEMIEYRLSRMEEL